MTEITTVQTVGWVLTGLGIAISLGWNLVNTRASNSLAQRLRVEQYRAGQWARIRARIDGALDDLTESVSFAVDQARKLAALEPTIELFNSVMIEAQDKLATALEEADLSPYCMGHCWAEAANGVLSGSETSWDLILRCVADAQAAPDKAAMIAGLQKMRPRVAEIRSRVSELCRVQDLEYDPHKL